MNFEVQWKKLLDDLLNGDAFKDPTFRTFHRFSWRNRLLAMSQMAETQPFGTYNFWKRQGRYVRKGEHASITLCSPVKAWVDDQDNPGKKIKVTVGFDYKHQWFRLDQTEGDEFAEVSETVNKVFDMSKLKVELVEFHHLNGNVHGYATWKDGKKVIAVNPLVPEWKRRIITSHEIAHCILHLGQNRQEMVDEMSLGYDIHEVEAETAAFLVESALTDTTEGMAFQYSRDYVRHWLRNNEFTEKMAERIIEAATKILDSTRDYDALRKGLA